MHLDNQTQPSADTATGAEIILPQLAHEINVRFDLADRCEQKAVEHRISAGVHLKKAKELIPKGQWEFWLKENIKRSRRDVYKCLALVKSDDPAEQEQALSRQRQAARERMARSRADVSNVGHTMDPQAAGSKHPYSTQYKEIRISLAWNAEQASRVLIRDAGRNFCRDLIEALQERIAETATSAAAAE